MGTVKPIIIPLIADPVLSPDFFYGDYTGIYFVTEDDKFGRITFENLDAVKICRGEVMPYEFDYSLSGPGCWIYKIGNSNWQKERFDYENEFYGSSYEFGRDVNEMLTDFSHYLFSFHDQFIEVITRGFWFEKADHSLFGKGLLEGHPFLPLLMDDVEIMTAHSLKAQIRKNPKSKEQLIYDAQFCSQKLYEFALELDGEAYVSYTLLLSFRNEELISSLRGVLGAEAAKFDGFADLVQVRPYVEKYMEEVRERRKGRCI